MNEPPICPHCHRPGIFVGARTYYSRGWPATCRACGALAYDRPHGIVTALSFILTCLDIPLSPNRKFRPISSSSSRLSRRLTYAAILVAIAVFAAVVFRPR